MKRIFLVGCPRSGTTLVQSLLASAEDITTFTESHFFDKCFGPLYEDVGKTSFNKSCVLETIDRFDTENGLPAYRASANTWQSSQTVARFFVEKLDQAATNRSTNGWVEKTPDHLRRIKFIASVIPDALFVHVIRDPGATVDSLQSASAMWGNPRTWIACAIKWFVSVKTSTGYVRQPGHAFVCYDDLVENSRKETQRLFSELGLQWDDGVLERYRKTALDVTTVAEEWKKNNKGEIRHQAKEKSDRPFYQRIAVLLLDRSYGKLKETAFESS